MRLSSRRLNVTRFVKAPAADWRAAARTSLGSASSEIKLMARLLSSTGHMIAPTEPLRKGGVTAPCLFGELRRAIFQPNRPVSPRHGIVSPIIIRPYFRPAGALLDCDKIRLRWPGPFDTGFLSPQPPGVVGTGSIAEQLIRDWGQRELVLFLLAGSFSFVIASEAIRQESPDCFHIRASARRRTSARRSAKTGHRFNAKLLRDFVASSSQ